MKKALLKHVIAKQMILPQKMVFPQVDNIDVTNCCSCKPIGMVEIEEIKANNLKSIFSELLGMSKCTAHIIDFNR